MIDVLRDEENYLPGFDLKEEGKYKLFKKSRVIKYVEDFEKAESEAKAESKAESKAEAKAESKATENLELWYSSEKSSDFHLNQLSKQLKDLNNYYSLNLLKI